MLEMRLSLAEPIQEIFEAAAVLNWAVDAHLAGDREQAARLFRQADCPKVWSYIDAGWGKGAKARYKFISVDGAPQYLARDLRPLPRMPDRETREAVKKRDGYHCRFCGMPIIDPSIRKAIAAAYPEVVGWPTTDVGKHAAFMCMWLQYDHILPNSRGGASNVDNIVLTCTACNFGRMETTLEEGRLIHPFAAERPKWSGFSDWDGLDRFMKGNG